MTIQWTNAAIEAALKSFHDGIEWPEDKPRMRAALDAAVELQGLETIGYRASEKAFESGRRVGRADALGEAAQIAESGMLPCDIGGELILDPFTASTIAAAIRALREKKG